MAKNAGSLDLMSISRPPAPAIGNMVARVLLVSEVAAALRVSKMTVYRLAHAGELDAVRIGRSVRIPEQAVSRYLAKDTAEQPPPEAA